MNVKLQMRTGNAWRHLITFNLEEVSAAQVCGQQLAAMSGRCGMPAELRILDGTERHVLSFIEPLGWRAPKDAEGYEWCP